MTTGRMYMLLNFSGIAAELRYYLSILVATFWLLPGEILLPTLLIFNNVFPLRLRKTVSIATTAPPKHIPAFDKKSSFDI